jgi:hypothetical protein
MLICRIMRLRSINFSVKLSYMYSACHVIYVVCGISHNSSRLESYGHEKLENLGLGNEPKFV